MTNTNRRNHRTRLVGLVCPSLAATGCFGPSLVDGDDAQGDPTQGDTERPSDDTADGGSEEGDHDTEGDEDGDEDSTTGNSDDVTTTGDEATTCRDCEPGVWDQSLWDAGCWQ
jgi:hypothetical protein